MTSPHTAYLVDASPYVFRAYFSLPDSIRTPAGEPINAAYGFASFLVKLIAEEAPSHLAVAFDESLNSSFRNEIYADYKAQRELPPATLEAQLGACREIAEAFGAAAYSHPTFEADDIVASLAEQVIAAGQRAVVVSGDKDLAQLVSERVVLYDFAREERLGPDEVVERFGCRPRQVADLLALQGDPVDNIPGVPGVGKKTACALLAAFQDLDELYARLDADGADAVAKLPIRGAASLAAAPPRAPRPRLPVAPPRHRGARRAVRRRSRHPRLPRCRSIARRSPVRAPRLRRHPRPHPTLARRLDVPAVPVFQPRRTLRSNTLSR